MSNQDLAFCRRYLLAQHHAPVVHQALPRREHCPYCGGELKIIAAILEAPVIERILTHLGLQARAPTRGQALQTA